MRLSVGETPVTGARVFWSESYRSGFYTNKVVSDPIPFFVSILYKLQSCVTTKVLRSNRLQIFSDEILLNLYEYLYLKDIKCKIVLRIVDIVSNFLWFLRNLFRKTNFDLTRV